jgi:hypothetical protein
MPRYQPPDRIIGSTNFSEHPELRGSLNTVRLVKSQPWVLDELREACNLEVNYARRREPGHWELAAIAFVASGHVDIEPWHREAPDELWRECGFEAKPTYIRTWRRLRELEKVGDAFLEAASKVIQHCRKQDARVMAHVHIDSTEDETHSSLVHDCGPDEECAARSVIGRRSYGHPIRPERASTSIARKHREELNAQAPTEDDEEPATPQDEDSPKDGDVEIVLRGTKLVKRLRREGCWYRTRDVEAGVRYYGGEKESKRFWHGYYSSKAVCHATGGVIPLVDNASRQECHLFPLLYDRVKEMTGEAPQTVIGDKGFSVESCFAHATENGTASVFPYRPGRWKETRRPDKLTHDRHGVMRCRHCGGPMQQVRFSAASGKARIWFKCMIGGTPECAGEQTINCDTDYRFLVPLARTEALYHELKASHMSYEGVHDYWRDRYKVAADTLALRPKVVSIDWHRLRANAACLIDWLRISIVNGWLEAKEASKSKGERRFKERGVRAASTLRKMRVRMGLAQPYGPKAARLGLGLELPPSERNRKKPRHQRSMPGP